jgi:hypothetical protein
MGPVVAGNRLVVWVVRALVVGVFVLDGPIILAPNHQPPSINLLSGLLAGLCITGLASLLGKLSKRFRAKYPLGAKRVGIVLYSVGIVIAVLCIGLAAFATFQGASRELVGVGASLAIVYWAAGWGLHRALTQDSDLGRATQKSAEVLDRSPSQDDHSIRRWKLALSIAVVAAVAVPAFGGTWRLAPGKWVDLTASQKERLSRLIERTDDCTSFPGESPYERVGCQIAQEQLRDGGAWHPPERVTPGYLAVNFFAIAGTFVLAWALVMIGPAIGGLYSAWLRR